MKSFLNCMTKIRYKTLRGAQDHADRNARKGRGKFYPYLCKECLEFHLTSKKPQKPVVKPIPPKKPVDSYKNYPIVREDSEYIYVALSKGNLYKLLNLGFELFDNSKTARLSKKRMRETI